MKKYLILSALALAGVLSSMEAKAAAYGFTAEGAYAISVTDKEKGGVDLYGGLLSLDMYTSKHNQFFLQAGYFSGDNSYSELDKTTQFTREQIPLYIGYNYNYGLTNRITAYFSAKAGMNKTDLGRRKSIRQRYSLFLRHRGWTQDASLLQLAIYRRLRILTFLRKLRILSGEGERRSGLPHHQGGLLLYFLNTSYCRQQTGKVSN